MVRATKYLFWLYACRAAELLSVNELYNMTGHSVRSLNDSSLIFIDSEGSKIEVVDMQSHDKQWHTVYEGSKGEFLNSGILPCVGEKFFWLFSKGRKVQRIDYTTSQVAKEFTLGNDLSAADCLSQGFVYSYLQPGDQSRIAFVGNDGVQNNNTFLLPLSVTGLSIASPISVSLVESSSWIIGLTSSNGTFSICKVLGWNTMELTRIIHPSIHSVVAVQWTSRSFNYTDLTGSGGFVILQSNHISNHSLLVFQPVLPSSAPIVLSNISSSVSEGVRLQMPLTLPWGINIPYLENSLALNHYPRNSSSFWFVIGTKEQLFKGIFRSPSENASESLCAMTGQVGQCSDVRSCGQAKFSDISICMSCSEYQDEIKNVCQSLNSFPGEFDLNNCGCDSSGGGEDDDKDGWLVNWFVVILFLLTLTGLYLGYRLYVENGTGNSRFWRIGGWRGLSGDDRGRTSEERDFFVFEEQQPPRVISPNSYPSSGQPQPVAGSSSVLLS